MKPARGQVASQPAAPLPITRDWEIDLQPQEILDHRWVLEARKPTLELLILWAYRPKEDATWENYDLFASQFPAFRLEDKSFYPDGSIDTSPPKSPIQSPIKVYSRRNKSGDPVSSIEQLKIIFENIFDPFYVEQGSSAFIG